MIKPSIAINDWCIGVEYVPENRMLVKRVFVFKNTLRNAIKIRKGVFEPLVSEQFKDKQLANMFVKKLKPYVDNANKKGGVYQPYLYELALKILYSEQSHTIKTPTKRR